ncbi:MAG: prolipoprotein diacylglyceryl transferase [Cyclobacteriaceae bacterium]
MISYIIWNGSPEIFSIGFFSLRYYGLLFALGFLISQQILYYIHKQEGKPEKDVDTLTVYMIMATIIGARLGHVLFYEPSTLWENPLSVFLPVQFSPFRFTGFTGLASHGGAIGILFALWLYSRKKKPGQNYLQVLDRIVILVCLTGGLIRLGNYFNSEIIGKPSNNPFSVVFINPVTERITRSDGGKGPIASLEVKRDKDRAESKNGHVPINLYLFFKPGTSESEATGFVEWQVRNVLATQKEFIDESASQLSYKITLEPSGTYAARVSTTAIARHPAQLYESISCFILFALLLWYWSKHKLNLPEGRIFGIFLITLWGLRFAYEFLKENQVSFEDKLSLNMGQNLSIPLILVGVFVLVRSFRTKSTS